MAAAPDDATLDAWVARREQGEPLAWITGSMTFAGRRIGVDPGVYVPRFQTEDLARRAALVLPEGGVAVDLCTGAGAVAAHLGAVHPAATIVGVEIDPTAAACARRNGVRVMVADVSAVPLRPGAFDVVTAVAPYVPTDAIAYLPADVQRHEPRVALDGGTDGLDVVRVVADAAARLLRAGGWFLTELGGEQLAALDLVGFAAPVPWFDDDGDLRGVAAERDVRP